jgi:hypothetical protein
MFHDTPKIYRKFAADYDRLHEERIAAFWNMSPT